MNGNKVLPMGMPRVGMQQPFDIADAVPRNCEKCNGEFFEKVLRLGIISKIAPSNKTARTSGSNSTHICAGIAATNSARP